MDGRSTSFSGGPSGSFGDNLLLASSSRQTLMPRRSLYRAFTKVKEYSASNLCWTLGTLMPTPTYPAACHTRYPQTHSALTVRREQQCSQPQIRLIGNFTSSTCVTAYLWSHIGYNAWRLSAVLCMLSTLLCWR